VHALTVSNSTFLFDICIFYLITLFYVKLRLVSLLILVNEYIIWLLKKETTTAKQYAAKTTLHYWKLVSFALTSTSEMTIYNDSRSNNAINTVHANVMIKSLKHDALELIYSILAELVMSSYQSEGPC